MLAIGFKFLAGRFHANPWGRHINEADVAWPPDPWRILRALIATWHHKVKHGQHREETLHKLIEALSVSLPSYALPPAVHTHTRHYMPQGTIVRKKGEPPREKTSLVFDAFARVNPEDELVASWPDVSLDDAQALLLDELLDKMGYLGRAESWVEARRVEDTRDTNCLPGDEPLDSETGELREVTTLLAPLASADYRRWREEFMRTDYARRKRAEQVKLDPTLGDNLIAALSADTADLQRAGWSQPPAARRVHYIRPADCLKPRRQLKPAPARSATTARFLLIAKPSPRIQDAVRVGEAIRRALMGKSRWLLGEDCIPSELSGHDLANGNRHAHAFYLPEDANGDGRVDHVLIHAPMGLTPATVRVFERLSIVRGKEGIEWRLVLESLGDAASAGKVSPLVRNATIWVSLTPYLHPWHAKKNFGVEDQLRRECHSRGLPDIFEIRRLPSITVKGKSLRPLHFHRFRDKGGLIQPDTHGSFIELEFAQPVRGPLALGFACHFGLGLFVPVESTDGPAPAQV